MSLISYYFLKGVDHEKGIVSVGVDRGYSERMW